MGSPIAGSILRQLSRKESTSKRWNKKRMHHNNLKQMEGFNNGTGMIITRKRVMVVVDQSSSSKHAMMWALTHVANKGDVLTLLHIIPPLNYHHRDDENYVNKTPDQRVISASTTSDGGDSDYHNHSSPNYLAISLATLCKACKPEVEVEALVIQGPKIGTVMSQVKKLEVSVLVLSQRKPTASLISCFCGISSSEDFVEYCINNADCLTLGVRKQSKGMGGYLIRTRWQKNFWLLA